LRRQLGDVGLSAINHQILQPFDALEEAGIAQGVMGGAQEVNVLDPKNQDHQCSQCRLNACAQVFAFAHNP